jgi:hypothetical protein
MNIITGYRGEAHITAQMDRDINRGIFGNDAHVVNLTGTGHLAATIVSANEIRIGAGLLVAQGCMAEIPHGTTESLTIANGAQGMQRRDLIVARYTRNAGTGVEDMSLVVKTGTPAATSPAAPGYTTGVIANGATLVEFPLFDVRIDGLTITSVNKRPIAIGTLQSIRTELDYVNDAFAQRALLQKDYHFTINYEAGTPGTRGAKMTISTNFKNDIQYDDAVVVGLAIVNFQATGTMILSPTVDNNAIFLSAYRASGNAATNVTGTLRLTCRHDY